MENTKMILWKVVFYDGEQAYVERFIAKPTDRKLLEKYMTRYGMNVLLMETDKFMLTENDLRALLEDECLRNRYIEMYMC